MDGQEKFVIDSIEQLKQLIGSCDDKIKDVQMLCPRSEFHSIAFGYANCLICGIATKETPTERAKRVNYKALTHISTVTDSVELKFDFSNTLGMYETEVAAARCCSMIFNGNREAGINDMLDNSERQGYVELVLSGWITCNPQRYKQLSLSKKFWVRVGLTPPKWYILGMDKYYGQ